MLSKPRATLRRNGINTESNLANSYFIRHFRVPLDFFVGAHCEERAEKNNFVKLICLTFVIDRIHSQSFVFR